MNSNIAQWRERLASRFPGLVAIDESVLRFTRDAGNRQFAVYYVDISHHLPATAEELTSYQDRVIGKNYFDGSKSLQWSNYLFFVVNADELKSADSPSRQLIEQDRSYARKFVVTEDEFEAAVTPLTVTSTGSFPATNILSIWTERLAKAGLDAAVLGGGSIPRRLALIEAASAPAKPKTKAAVASKPAAAPPQLRSVALTRFRECPTCRSFEFGTVNLIVGANGTGKTSLLEAIELLYCGRTKRNPQTAEEYEFNAMFTDGKSEKAGSSRTQKLFRDRNLAWYGQSEVKTWNLYSSFAQFNFLDTDAAVGLAESDEQQLEDDLSKLLVGPEASQAWEEIVRISDAVAGRLRELQPEQRRIQSETVALDAQIKSAQAVTQESDAILKRLADMVRRSSWAIPEIAKDAVPAYFIEPFTELESLIGQASSIERVASPVSIAGLRAFCDESARMTAKADADITRLEQLKKEEQRLGGVGRRIQLAVGLALEAERIVAASLPSRLAELQQLRTSLAKARSILSGIDEPLLAQLKVLPESTTVAAHQQLVTATAATARQTRTTAQSQHAAFSELQNKSATLAQELREIAAQLLEGSSIPDRCPLCHTQFEEGQLHAHIYQDIDAAIESRGQALLALVRASEEQLRLATLGISVAASAIDYCKRAAIPVSQTVSSIVASIETEMKSLADAQRRADVIDRELIGLKAQGLSADRVAEVQRELASAGYPLMEWTTEAVAGMKAMLEEASASNTKLLDEQRLASEQLQKSIAVVFQVMTAEIAPLKTASSKIKEQRTLAISLLGELRDLIVPFPWKEERPLTELRLAVESIRQVAAELQVALSREKQAKSLTDESVKRKDTIAKQLVALNITTAKFVGAQTVLKDLTDNHSLSGAMSAAIQQNRQAIESIFGRIHAPAEFSGLGKKITTLVRKVGGAEAALSQISTGQRAAFALSLFLAQNSQLKSAPPILLIDDPIAHVDDLNSLSFLDFLRDLSISGKRQIFFATANEKLATLFERKFDFLGKDGFKRYDLHR